MNFSLGIRPVRKRKRQRVPLWDLPNLFQTSFGLQFAPKSTTLAIPKAAKAGREGEEKAVTVTAGCFLQPVYAWTETSGCLQAKWNNVATLCVRIGSELQAFNYRHTVTAFELMGNLPTLVLPLAKK